MFFLMFQWALFCAIMHPNNSQFNQPQFNYPIFVAQNANTNQFTQTQLVYQQPTITFPSMPTRPNGPQYQNYASIPYQPAPNIVTFSNPFPQLQPTIFSQPPPVIQRHVIQPPVIQATVQYVPAMTTANLHKPTNNNIKKVDVEKKQSPEDKKC